MTRAERQEIERETLEGVLSILDDSSTITQFRTRIENMLADLN